MFCCSRRAARRQEEAEQRQDAVLSAASSCNSNAVLIAGQRNFSAQVQPLTQAARSLNSRPPATRQQAQAAAERTQAAARPVPSAVSSPEDDRTCRVCWGGETPEEPLIRPCGCKGTLTWAHRDCIRQWIDRSKRIKCEICRQPLLPRRQALLVASCATFNSIINAWFFANFIMLAANLPGLLGLFAYQLTMPLRIPLDQAFEQPCHSFNSCLRLQMPLVVTGDTLLYIIAALQTVGAFRRGTRPTVRGIKAFTNELVSLMANRSVATVVKEALGHSQRNGWIVAAASVALLSMPWALSYPAEVMFGAHAAKVVYMYGYCAEAVILPWLKPVQRHLFAHRPAHAQPVQAA